MGGGGKTKYYGVLKGRVTGVFLSWYESKLEMFIHILYRKECSEQVHGYRDAKFKSFQTRAEASAFATGTSVAHSPQPTAPQSPTTTGIQTVFVDGSCKGPENDRRAGYGVFFGHGDSRNASGPITTGRATNNRGELMGAIIAAETSGLGDVKLFCDSTYVVKGATDWIRKWKTNGFKKANGGEVENKDLWIRLDVALETRRKAGLLTAFEWVKGHSTSAGNAMADKLANEGADMDRKLKRERETDEPDAESTAKYARL